MIHYQHTIAGDIVDIYYPESRKDLAGFEAFLAQGDKVLGYDVETTGLDIYSSTFEVRLAQFGNGREAWVLRVDMFADVIARTLKSNRRFVAHNKAYELLVTDRHLGVTIEELNGRLFDTRIMAHLLDPRQPHEGGAGLSLKPLSAIYVDDTAPDTQAGLHAVFRSITNPDTGKPCTTANGWRHIPIDHPTYILYSGLDPVLTWRLFYQLKDMIQGAGLANLAQFEEHLQGLLCVMTRKGLLIDVPYTEQLRKDLEDEAVHYSAIAARYGVDNVNSDKQIGEALVAMGETLTERTPSGAVKVDKAVLAPLADIEPRTWDRIGAREPNPLADAVMRAKRAGKWAKSYAQAFLDQRDSDNRIHPWIGGLQARTARMSISGIPLQQLPSGDWRVRRCIVAEPGNVYASIDYQAVELRVLAALADVTKMKEAIATGADLHAYTARLVFGDDFTKTQRGISKAISFGKVYGGGATTVQRQTGAPMDAVKRAMVAYDNVYPEVKRYGAKLQKRAQFGKREVITVSGRHLPLDRDRLYAATNYVVQSTSRDLLAQAIVDVADAGLLDYVRLPVHDELVIEVPEGPEGEQIMNTIAKLMETEKFYSVPIESDPEVYGFSWGHGYGIPEDSPWRTK